MISIVIDLSNGFSNIDFYQLPMSGNKPQEKLTSGESGARLGGGGEDGASPPTLFTLRLFFLHSPHPSKEVLEKILIRVSHWHLQNPTPSQTKGLQFYTPYMYERTRGDPLYSLLVNLPSSDTFRLYFLNEDS